MKKQLIEALAKDYPDLKPDVQYGDEGFTYKGVFYNTTGYNLLAVCDMLARAMQGELL